MKACRWSRVIAPFILNLGTRVIIFTPRPLYLWERTPVPIELEAVRTSRRREKSFSLPGFESWTFQPIAYSLYPCSTLLQLLTQYKEVSNTLHKE
jgi:hypothetical protein